MAEFKDVVEKCKDICRRFESCSDGCPLHGYNQCPTFYDTDLQKLEDKIMNYELKGEREW